MTAPQKAFPLLAVATVLAGMADHERAHQVAEVSLIAALLAEVLNQRDTLDPADLTLLLASLSAAGTGGWFIATSTHQPDPHGMNAGFLRGVAGFSVSQAATLALLVRRGAGPHAGEWPLRGALAVAGLTLVGLRDRRNLLPLAGYGSLLSAAALLSAHPDVNRRSQALRRGGWCFLTSDLLILLRRYLLRGRTQRALTEGAMLALYAAAQHQLVTGLLEAPRRAGTEATSTA